MLELSSADEIQPVCCLRSSESAGPGGRRWGGPGCWKRCGGTEPALLCGGGGPGGGGGTTVGAFAGAEPALCGCGAACILRGGALGSISQGLVKCVAGSWSLGGGGKLGDSTLGGPLKVRV